MTITNIKHLGKLCKLLLSVCHAICNCRQEIYNYTGVHCIYRTLRGRDQREKCTLNVVKYTFQVKCTLLTTKSALTVQ